MGLVSNLAFTIITVFIFLIFELLFADDLFIIKINIEEDLSRVFFQ